MTVCPVGARRRHHFVGLLVAFDAAHQAADGRARPRTATGVAHDRAADRAKHQCW